MATIVCHHHQSLPSCLESLMVEPTALRLTLSSSRPHSVNLNPEPGGWSVLQAMFDGPRLSIEGNGHTYVHPLVERSLSALSDKSLELCTENLGSETGSDDVLDDGDDIFSLSPSLNPPTWKQHKSRRVSGGKKAIGVDFPPPLTTISGAESIRVRPYRENGRLEEETAADEENDNNDNIDNENDEEEEFRNDSNTIVVEEEEMGRTKFERRESIGGCGGGGSGHGEQRMAKLGGYIRSFVLDLPV
ncbi:hypothetical protein F3Y22_tig00110044pilonHSYRG00253 [Hibiscus syriacus]|uniref:FAF domain-containing protein n=1 Tax=Hibiscus syriacus TaxID=106335 RepID=A0A6A3BQC2_HIBSY|nr:hypothetical protein F3Y22_tig00110044pilonHSYRG00253 [Hibiscus syriacus]